MKVCNCEVTHVVGLYNNQVTLVPPDFMLPLRNALGEVKLMQIVCVDKCLENEIKALWGMGIKTTGCCCGHNRITGYIGVVSECVDEMVRIGYGFAPNDTHNLSFIPKYINK